MYPADMVIRRTYELEETLHWILSQHPSSSDVCIDLGKMGILLTPRGSEGGEMNVAEIEVIRESCLIFIWRSRRGSAEDAVMDIIVKLLEVDDALAENANEGVRGGAGLSPTECLAGRESIF